MGVKVRTIDQLDEYRRKINQIGKYQVERLTIPVFIYDWAYILFGKGMQVTFSKKDTTKYRPEYQRSN